MVDAEHVLGQVRAACRRQIPVPLKCEILPGRDRSDRGAGAPADHQHAFPFRQRSSPRFRCAVNSLTLTTGLPSRNCASTRSRGGGSDAFDVFEFDAEDQRRVFPARRPPRRPDRRAGSFDVPAAILENDGVGGWNRRYRCRPIISDAGSCPAGLEAGAAASRATTRRPGASAALAGPGDCDLFKNGARKADSVG